MASSVIRVSIDLQSLLYRAFAGVYTAGRVQIFTDQIVGHEQWIYGIYDVELIDFQFDILSHEAYQSGDIDTDFIPKYFA